MYKFYFLFFNACLKIWANLHEEPRSTISAIRPKVMHGHQQVKQPTQFDHIIRQSQPKTHQTN